MEKEYQLVPLVDGLPKKGFSRGNQKTKNLFTHTTSQRI